MTPEIKNRIDQIRRGEMPEGWKSVPLGSLGTAKNGLNYDRESSGLVIKILGVGDFKDKSVLPDVNSLQTVSLSTKPESDYFLKDGDIVFVRSNGSRELVGRNLLVHPGKNPVTYSGFCIRFRIAPDANTTPEYINLFLDNGALKRQLIKENQGTHINNLNQDILRKLVILLPPIKEQQKIAKILTIQDKIIERKEKLIAEKQRQKKYLMQQLLTGKKRLPGEFGTWKTEPLGKLFLNRAETNRKDLQLLAITGTRGVVPRSELDLKDNSSEDKSKYLRICVGDIGYNTMRMWQGVSAYSTYEGIVSPAYTILKPVNSISAKYFAYLFKMPEIVFLFYRFSQGLVDDTRNLKYENFKKIRVAYPESLLEQNAIVKILETADQEITLLQRSLEQEKQKKKALMQLLLTGIVRVNA